MFPTQHDRDYYRSLSPCGLIAEADSFGDNIPPEIAVALRDALEQALDDADEAYRA